MGRDEALAKLRELEGSLKSRGIIHLYLFGSVAREEAVAGSDVDVAFDVAPGVKFDAFDQGSIYMNLADALGVEVDLVERRAMSSRFAERVLPDLVQVF
jgi:predicted nucleotidyltransferase